MKSYPGSEHNGPVDHTVCAVGLLRTNLTFSCYIIDFSTVN